MIQLRQFLVLKLVCQRHGKSDKVSLLNLNFKAATGCVVAGALESYQKCEGKKRISMLLWQLGSICVFLCLHQFLLHNFQKLQKKTSKLPTGAGGFAAFSGAVFFALTGGGASEVFFDFALKKMLQDSEEEILNKILWSIFWDKKGSKCER